MSQITDHLLPKGMSGSAGWTWICFFQLVAVKSWTGFKISSIPRRHENCVGAEWLYLLLLFTFCLPSTHFVKITSNLLNLTSMTASCLLLHWNPSKWFRIHQLVSNSNCTLQIQKKKEPSAVVRNEVESKNESINIKQWCGVSAGLPLYTGDL